MTNWVNVVGPCAATDRSLQGGEYFFTLAFSEKKYYIGWFIFFWGGLA
jgi:hypothetical protein